MANAEVTFERSLYIGNSFAGILYGAHHYSYLTAASGLTASHAPAGLQLWMYFQSVWSLFKSRSSHYKTRRFYVIYGGILLILLTFSILSNALFGQEAWIEHRAEMDPAEFLAENTSLWYNTLGSAADITVNFMGDGLLVYRCYMIWGSRLWVVAFPFIIYLASTAMAISTVVEGALPGASIFVGRSIDFGIAWVSLTVGLNVIVTVLISTRLLMMRNVARSVLSPDMAKMYTSIMAILVESALPFSVLGIGFVVTYAKSSPTEFAFACVWGTFCVSPYSRPSSLPPPSEASVPLPLNPISVSGSRVSAAYHPACGNGRRLVKRDRRADDEPSEPRDAYLRTLHTQGRQRSRADPKLRRASSSNYTAGTSTLYPWSKNSNKSEKSLASDVELAEV
ncbi:hypothetical protein EVG20_g3679 [Dentipellis fragilis]|uniref:Uncharacterized protein n=1 Tax=Dentipellis fragilis TaxID=205917 RepID=A0A4Y9Z274_9AGAM|nr:hypothetical protein EVG20_g3679 [Dentipellis fragilis]